MEVQRLQRHAGHHLAPSAKQARITARYDRAETFQKQHLRRANPLSRFTVRKPRIDRHSINGASDSTDGNRSAIFSTPHCRLGTLVRIAAAETGPLVGFRVTDDQARKSVV